MIAVKRKPVTYNETDMYKYEELEKLGDSCFARKFYEKRRSLTEGFTAEAKFSTVQRDEQ